ncbi:hypothetical protein FE391_25900 [Nonomuraea sp. KC401]|uniref:hypothetical protein n=1 Tax=unclassified Nonomuraea TaxID=2593643 RepID=UPI0010FDCC1E|nr:MULTISPECIES: hypothetical protein [unclassified Nonomuraea]NBE97244.1 hypothetical protein [Nonomuraea sp. K271]TLF65897.1 hypothetical protein FE391_25900 [Nonomuraea sp. KC401]
MSLLDHRFAGTLLDALRYFMDQRRYDPWAGTLWHEFCLDDHPTAVTNRVLNHLKMRNADPALLKPLALWEPGAPHHLHPAETLEDLDLPEAALLLAGEGLRPWESVTSPQIDLRGRARGMDRTDRQNLKPIGSF